MTSRKYVGRSSAPYEVIGLEKLCVKLSRPGGGSSSYRQAVGTIPPVKIVAYGKATPATRPSMSSRTSRKGPCPKATPGGKLVRKVFAVLKYWFRY